MIEKEDETFTLVFKGDIQSFKGNPYLTDTPFGRPIASGVGNALGQVRVYGENLAAAISVWALSEPGSLKDSAAEEVCEILWDMR